MSQSSTPDHQACISRRPSLPAARAWTRLLLPFLLLLSAAAPPTPVPPTPVPPTPVPPTPVPVYRAFGQWFVACDNTRTCVARGFDASTQAQLDLTRAAGDAPATLAFSADPAIQPQGLQLDGAPLPLPTPAWRMEDGVLTTMDPAAIRAFVAAVRNGHVITLDPESAKRDRPRTVPLEGFTAALLLVDAVQGRPGTPTALIAPTGEAAPPKAPPLPRMPRWIKPPALTRAETRRLLQYAGTMRSTAFDACNVTEPSHVYALDAVNALAMRTCYRAAYQESAIVVVLPRAGGAGRPATTGLPGIPRKEPATVDMVGVDFDPATGQLSSASKGRGIADCGLSQTWVWSAGQFRLTDLAYQEACGGANPGDWPTLYRSRK